MIHIVGTQGVLTLDFCSHKGESDLKQKYKPNEMLCLLQTLIFLIAVGL